LNSDGFRGKKLSVRDAVEYFKLLTEHFVEVDHRLRRKKIEEAIDLYGEQFNASVPLREELAEENTFLTEFVHPILGSFEEKYLELPPLVIITVAAHHQRFFCFQREDGGVVPKFLAISNNAPKDDAVVREGFEKVLRARLEDALFFYREDLRTPLESLVPRLKGVLQHPDLGTLYDKTMRLVKLGRHLSERLYPDRKEKVERAAYLSKADLLTEMVKELDELQGYMGFVYAKAQGEDPEVALALWEQYKPKGAEDELPSTPTGTLLSVADKLHDLVGYFGVGEKPRSTADPLGLRRAALGIIRILEAMRLELDLGEAAGFTYRLFGRLKLTEEETLRELENFFRQRLINYLAARYPRELVVAVAEGRSGFEVVRIVDAVERLAKLLAAEELAVAREVYRRVKKILSKVKETYEVDESLLTLPEERELFKAVGELEARFPSLSLEEKVERLAGLKGAVDRFFDNVMVMDKDDRLRKNRIALLQRAKALFESVADLEKLPVKD
jgi:glycyl-tRNA synthetase beta chain